MMSLREAAAILGARAPDADAVLAGVSTDSRTIGRGELFVALRGERFDGHAFLAAATRAGAAAAIVDRDYRGAPPLPVIAVRDTRRGLADLARSWRARFAPVLIAVTGSNGKTTVKEMLASILRRHAGAGAVLATAGNLNNDIGVPLTLLGLAHRHRWCVIELGMNHRGEIAYLSGIARPTVALVNNAQREHLEFMGSVDEVAAENASVYEALPAEGIAVLNAEDPHAGLFRKQAGSRRTVEFGLESGDVTGRYELKGLESRVLVTTRSGEASATLAIAGLHNVLNALAAAACAHAAGVAPAAIGAGLSAFRPYAGRLQVKRTARGATLIDDSYNANPDSVRAAIDILAGCAAPRVLVLGDMGELGEQGPEFHAEVGKYAREKGVSKLFSLGKASNHAVKAFGDGGRHFEELNDLVANLKDATTILVKGSRFMRMERVVSALTGEPERGH